MNLFDLILKALGVNKRPPYSPILTAPDPAAMDLINPVNFTWASGGRLQWPETYILQIAGDANFSAMIFNQNLQSVLMFSMGGFAFGQTSFWRMRARNKYGYSDWSIVRGFTMQDAPPPPPPPLPPDPVRKYTLFLPERADTTAVADGLTYCKQLASDWNTLKNPGDEMRVVVNSPFYGGTWNIESTDNWGVKDCYHEIFALCQSLGLKVDFGAFKLTKCALEQGNPLNAGTVTIEKISGEPVDLLPRVTHQGIVPVQTSGVWPGQMLTISLAPSEIGRHFTLRLNTSNPVWVRWFPTEHPDAKFVDHQEVTGEREFEVITNWSNSWNLMLFNPGSSPVDYEILELIETPVPSDQMRSETATQYEWYGNRSRFLYPSEHPRYHDADTIRRHLAVFDILFAEYGIYSCIENLFGGGDEIHCLECEPGFTNIGQMLEEFMAPLAEAIFARSGWKLAHWTMAYGTNGYYANDLTGGGISDIPSRWIAGQPRKPVLYDWNMRTAANMERIIDLFGECHVHLALYDEAEYQAISAIKAERDKLPAEKRGKVFPWFYSESRTECVIANIRRFKQAWDA